MNASTATKNVNPRAVIHHIVPLRIGLAIAEGHAIAPSQIIDLFDGAGQADGVGAECRGVRLEYGVGVALGVHADEQDTDILALRAKLLHHIRHELHGGRTNIRAMGVAEVKQNNLALVVLRRDLLPQIVGEIEFEIGHHAGDVAELPGLVVVVPAARQRQGQRSQQNEAARQESRLRQDGRQRHGEFRKKRSFSNRLALCRVRARLSVTTRVTTLYQARRNQTSPSHSKAL